METSKPIHLLVDGDITYHLNARRKHEDGTPYTFDDAAAAIRWHYDWLMETLGADKMTVVLSGPSGQNFRKRLYEPYKGDRPTERPPLLDELKQFLRDEYSTHMVDDLEADDVLGIMSTEPADEERIIVSSDKDLAQIPGLLFNPRHHELGVQEITRASGDKQFYTQWMTGDSTDCYPGIPGFGPKKAEKLFVRVKQKYVDADGLVPWRQLLEEEILQTFHRHGLTYEYALTQARLARILRHGDIQEGEVKLWTPCV